MTSFHHKFSRRPVRMTILVLSVALLAVSMILPIAAIDDTANWTYSLEFVSLTGQFPTRDGGTPCEKVYYPFAGSGRLYPEPADEMIEYASRVMCGDAEYELFAPAYAGESVLLYYRNVPPGHSTPLPELYMTKEGTHAARALIDSGAWSQYQILRVGTEARTRGSLDDYIIPQLESTLASPSVEGTMTLTLPELRYAERLTALGYDKDGLYGVAVGCFYRLEGMLAYLSFRDLPDEAFAGNGELDYTDQRTVTLLPVPQGVVGDVEYAEMMATTAPVDIVAEDNLHGDPSITFLYVVVVFCGLILPILPLTLGLCLPHAKGRQGQKRWYALAALGGTWMLLGAALLAILVAVL